MRSGRLCRSSPDEYCGVDEVTVLALRPRRCGEMLVRLAGGSVRLSVIARLTPGISHKSRRRHCGTSSEVDWRSDAHS